MNMESGAPFSCKGHAFPNHSDCRASHTATFVFAAPKSRHQGGAVESIAAGGS